MCFTSFTNSTNINTKNIKYFIFSDNTVSNININKNNNYARIFNKVTYIFITSLITKSSRRGPSSRVYNPGKNFTKTRGIWNYTNIYNIPSKSNTSKTSFSFNCSNWRNCDSINMFTTTRSKINNCLLFSQTYSSRSDRSVFNVIIRMTRIYNNNNRTWSNKISYIRNSKYKLFINQYTKNDNIKRGFIYPPHYKIIMIHSTNNKYSITTFLKPSCRNLNYYKNNIPIFNYIFTNHTNYNIYYCLLIKNLYHNMSRKAQHIIKPMIMKQYI